MPTLNLRPKAEGISFFKASDFFFQVSQLVLIHSANGEPLFSNNHLAINKSYASLLWVFCLYTTVVG